MKRIIFYLAIFILLVSLGNIECMGLSRKKLSSNDGPLTTSCLAWGVSHALDGLSFDDAALYLNELEMRVGIKCEQASTGKHLEERRQLNDDSMKRRLSLAKASASGSREDSFWFRYDTQQYTPQGSRIIPL